MQEYFRHELDLMISFVYVLLVNTNGVDPYYWVPNSLKRIKLHLTANMLVDCPPPPLLNLRVSRQFFGLALADLF